MASPTFVNAGAGASPANVTSVTPGNPASLVSGNLLICTVSAITNNITYTMPAGWTKMFTEYNSHTIFWKITTGTEGANTVTCSALTNPYAQIIQYTGNVTSGTPVKRTFKCRDSATLDTYQYMGSVAALTDASTVVAFILDGSGVNTSLASGWTQQLNNTGGGIAVFDTPMTTAGYAPDLWIQRGSAINFKNCTLFEIISQTTLNTSAFPQPYIVAQEAPTIQNAVNSVTITLPLNRVTGNVMVLFGSPGGSNTITATGYVRFASIANSNFQMLYRVLDGSEADTLTVNFSSTSNGDVWACEFANISTTCPFAFFNVSTNTGAGTTDSDPGFTTLRANVLAISMFSNNVSTTFWTTGALAGSWKRGVQQGNQGFVFQPMGANGSSTGTWSQTTGSSSTWFVADFMALPPGTSAPLAVEQATPKTFSGASSTTITISTNGPDRILFIAIVMENSTLQTVSGISGGGVTWAKRSSITNAAVSRNTNLELWWAYASAQLTSQVITITLSANTDDASAGYWAVANVPSANYANPFDRNVSLPASGFHGSGGVQPSVTITTTQAEELVFGIIGTPNNVQWSTPATGHIELVTAYNPGGAVFSDLNVEYILTGSAYSSSAFDITNQTGATNFLVLGDALLGSSLATPKSRAMWIG